MEAFQAVLGFILGVIIFLIMLSKLRVIFMGYYVMVFFFMISLALGMILAKIFSWLVVILIVIGVIAYLYFKFTDDSSPPSNQGNAEETTEAQDTTTDSENE